MNEPDLTPRSTPPPLSAKSPTRITRKRVGLGAILLLVAGGLGFLLFITLSGASLFFLDVDEAVERREELGSERFRIQGITVPRTIDREADVLNSATGERMSAVTFQIAFNGKVANVVHSGGLADIFADCLPVILEGHWETGGRDIFGEISPHYFASSEMLVKHDNDYTLIDDDADTSSDYSDQNPERIEDALGEDSIGIQDPLGGCPQT